MPEARIPSCALRAATIVLPQALTSIFRCIPSQGLALMNFSVVCRPGTWICRIGAVKSSAIGLEDVWNVQKFDNVNMMLKHLRYNCFHGASVTAVCWLAKRIQKEGTKGRQAPSYLYVRALWMKQVFWSLV